ncbi:MAG: hypothetical protein WD118_04680 [Phycisphaeraceae bacterium]
MADGDTLKKVQTGQPLKIPAQAYNAFIDTARAHAQREQDRHRHASPPGSGAGTVLVRNDSGEDRDRFDVLGLDAPLITPEDNLPQFTNHVALKGVLPTADYRGRFALLLAPLKAGRIGHALLSGVSVARLKLLSPLHTHAQVAAGEAGYLLSSVGGAAQILWHDQPEAGQEDEPVWAVVRLGPADSETQIVMARNEEDATLPVHRPVGVLPPADMLDGDPEASFDERVIFRCGDVTDPDRNLIIGVVRQPIEPGAVGPVQIGGIAQTSIYWPTTIINEGRLPRYARPHTSHSGHLEAVRDENGWGPVQVLSIAHTDPVSASRVYDTLVHLTPCGVNHRYTNRVLLRETGTWQIPNWVHRIKIWMVGGGSGGRGGHAAHTVDLTTGPPTDVDGSVDDHTHVISFDVGYSGGFGGSSGTELRAEIESRADFTLAGKTLAITIGDGGAGVAPGASLDDSYGESTWVRLHEGGRKYLDLKALSSRIASGSLHTVVWGENTSSGGAVDGDLVVNLETARGRAGTPGSTGTTEPDGIARHGTAGRGGHPTYHVPTLLGSGQRYCGAGGVGGSTTGAHGEIGAVVIWY